MTADMLKLIHQPARWSDFVVGDVTPERLENVASVLRGPAATDDVAAARLAHVLLLLGRPREAHELLKGRSLRLCVAQDLLAQVQIAQSENGIARYGKILSATRHFGLVDNMLDVEAQMRLDYARALAYQALGAAEAGEHFGYAVHLACLLGMPQMADVVRAVQQRGEAERSPVKHANQLGLLAVEAYHRGNTALASDLMHSSCRLLLGAGMYTDIERLADSWVKMFPLQAIQWRHGVQIAMIRTCEPFPHPIDENDPLQLMTESIRLLHGLTRAKERLDDAEARALAGQLLRLPSWPLRGPRTTAEGMYSLARVVATEAVSGPQHALSALRAALDGEYQHTGKHLMFYFSAYALELYARTGEELLRLPATAAWENMRHVLDEFSPNQQRVLLRRAIKGAPNAVLALSLDASMPAVVQEMIQAQSLILSDSGLSYAGAPVRGFPRQSAGLLRDLLDGKASIDPRRPVSLTRYRAALASHPHEPLALTSRAEQILKLAHPLLTDTVNAAHQLRDKENP